MRDAAVGVGDPGAGGLEVVVELEDAAVDVGDERAVRGGGGDAGDLWGFLDMAMSVSRGGLLGKREEGEGWVTLNIWGALARS